MGQSPAGVLFLDAANNIGWITADLSIEYDGPEHVEAYVTDVVNTASSDEQAIKQILLDMIHDLDVKEVRRAGSEDLTTPRAVSCLTAAD